MNIERNLAHVLKEIGERTIALVVVTKGHTPQEIRQVYELGCLDFGENRIQEALAKKEQLPADIRWHLIGRVQKNKVAKIIGNFALIHSVDSVELAQKIDEESRKRGVRTAILLQANTSQEATKAGLSPEEWIKNFEQVLVLPGIEIMGLMTIAPLTEDESTIRRAFAALRALQERLQAIAGERADLSTLSMGMSNDYLIAIDEGTTLLRLGSAIFAPR